MYPDNEDIKDDTVDLNNVVDSLQRENEELRRTLFKMKLQSFKNIQLNDLKSFFNSPYYHGFCLGFMIAVFIYSLGE